MKIHYWAPLVASLLLHSSLFVHTKSNFKFGKITPQDFDLSGNNVSTSAPGVVIADLCYWNYNNGDMILLGKMKQESLETP